MAGMQRVKLPEHHAYFFLAPWEFKAEKTVQRLELLGARAFNFGVQ